MVEAQHQPLHGGSFPGSARGRLRGLFTALCALFAVALLGASSPSAQHAVPLVPRGDVVLSKDRPFKAVSAGPTELKPGDHFQLRYTVHVLDQDHYLYKEMMKVEPRPVEGITLSELKFSIPAVTKYDQFEERDREIFKTPVTMYFEVDVAADARPGPRSLEALVRYQGCNPTTCFMPTKESHTLTFSVSAREAGLLPAVQPSAPTGAGGSDGASKAETVPAAQANAEGVEAEAGVDPVAEEGAQGSEALAAVSAPAPKGEGFQLTQEVGFVTSLFGSGLFATFLGVFVLGIFASFTPCIYPIIPITISVLGAKDARSRFHGFALALVYVLGLSVTYTLLGVAAASTGMIFGAVLQNDIVVSVIAGVFILMGFGMLGAFQVAMPSGIASRLSQVEGRGMPGAFITGAIAGLVASPCVGPLIVSLLAYIAQTGDLVLGSALMFTFAFGMGQLFLLLGTFAIGMPRSGDWMDTVKGGLALMLFGVGLFYLQTVIRPGVYELVVGSSALIAATFVGAFLRLEEDSSTIIKVRKASGILLALVGAYAFVGGLLGTGIIAPQMSMALQSGANASPTEKVAGIRWESDLEGALEKARQSGSPLLVDFTADWCAACKELEHLTFSDPRVVELASGFVPVRVDATDSSPEFEALKARYGIMGLPYVMFLSPQGEPMNNLTVTGFLPANQFLQRMCQVHKPTTERMQNVCAS